jgi:hypothetical protein
MTLVSLGAAKASISATLAAASHASVGVQMVLFMLPLLAGSVSQPCPGVASAV